MLAVRPSSRLYSVRMNAEAPSVAVVGGGWGGWGAAKALCEAGCRVTLLDALPDPTGATPYLSSSGKPVEAGTRGFWKDYPNIEATLAELGVAEEDAFTPFTNSSFYSPFGLEATAPVFSQSTFPTLPSPLGQVLATFPLFERIPLSDRATMAGLLLATLDCLGGSEEVQAQYDRMTAHELFIRFGLSERLVEDFVKPTLLVGLFAPPEELSALVVMELLYYYALAHQDSFDVRWIRRGTVASTLIAPLAEKLQAEYNLTVLGGSRVTEISLTEGEAGKHNVDKIEFVGQDGSTDALDGLDGVVLALGPKGTKAVVSSSPDLAKFPVFSKAASLGGIDVIATRLWLDRKVATRTPANVFSRFEALRGAGGTFFMLDQLQVQSDDDAAFLWGEEPTAEGETPAMPWDERGSVVAADFYNSGALMSLSDEEIVRVLKEDLLPEAVPEFRDAAVVDAWVARYPGAVTWFSPGSYAKRPPLQGAGVGVLPGVKFAGDWVRMGDREHGAKGLCQERAFVSGLEAANALLDSMAVRSARRHKVLPVRDDEPQVKAGMEVSRSMFSVLPRFWVR